MLKQHVPLQLRSSVTHIIHNAWKVDFNLSLSSFESQIAGTRKLADFCASTGRPVRMLFTSSISVAYGWPSVDGPIPESPLDDPRYAMRSGYAESKFVVEQVCPWQYCRVSLRTYSTARQLFSKLYSNGLEATSLRVGQVCGSGKSGAWNVTDWVPVLLKTSLSLGYLPEIKEASHNVC